MEKTICEKSELCTGCTACKNVCPSDCIYMEENDDGFKYPMINETKCIECNACRNVCPVNNVIKGEKVKRAYIARYKDPVIVENSTSGGVFSALADYVFSKDGVVYGVGYDSNMIVCHFGITMKEKRRLSEMRGSKYVQSELKDTFKEIQIYLKAGRLVCFSGTPCQIAGLKAYLKKEYEQLITVEVVCHGVASPMVFRKYINYLEKKNNSKVLDVRFRNKTYGYHSGTMKVSFENHRHYSGSGRVDFMSKAYFKGACSRESCYQCPFKGMDRISDFTIFDSWNVNEIVPEIKDDDKGFTNILINTEKGIRLIPKLQKYLYMWKVDYRKVVKFDGIMLLNNPEKYNYRNEMMKELKSGDFEEIMSKFLKVNLNDYVIENLKKIAYKMGILKLIKRIKHE